MSQSFECNSYNEICCYLTNTCTNCTILLMLTYSSFVNRIYK